MLAGIQTKLIIGAVMVALGGGFVWHYKSVIAERDLLRADVITYKANEAKLQKAIEDERTATQQAVSDRANMKRRLDKLREGRENDLEAQEWAATPLPAGERQRLCEALPTAGGCSEPVQPR